jgi:hypothetical protein
LCGDEVWWTSDEDESWSLVRHVAALGLGVLSGAKSLPISLAAATGRSDAEDPT